MGPCPGLKHCLTCDFIFPSQWLPVVRNPNSDAGSSSRSPRSPKLIPGRATVSTSLSPNPGCQACVPPGGPSAAGTGLRSGERSPGDWGPGKENKQIYCHRKNKKKLEIRQDSQLLQPRWGPWTPGEGNEHPHGHGLSRLLAPGMKVRLPACRDTADGRRRGLACWDEAWGCRSAVPWGPRPRARRGVGVQVGSAVGAKAQGASVC